MWKTYFGIINLYKWHKHNKGKAIPITRLDISWGFQEAEDPRFHDNWHMKVVRLSVLRTGPLHHPQNIPGTPFLLEATSNLGH